MIRLFVCLMFALATPAYGQGLSVGTFNVESDRDTQAELVAEDFARLPPMHAWGLQEVENQETLDLFVATLNEATGYEYAGHMGTTGGRYGDYLAIIYMVPAFTDVAIVEMDEVGGSRHPLMMTATAWNGTDITLINVHFNRGDETTRQGQARRLRDWIAAHPEQAIIALGDFNFDYDFRGARQGGNRAFSQFADGGHVSWPQPMCLENETCPATGSQCNQRYQSILDFIFLGGEAFDWRAMTDLAFLEEHYCRREGDGYADHRPVLGQILLPSSD
jgi:endonuclease/exonuclease/phosphatase family metal-dependent hydrolase